MQWLSRDAAIARLKVKPQTLYAYVSRGLLAARPAEDDPRTSLYSAADVAALVQRRRRGRKRVDIAQRAIAWGDPVLESAIATVREGRLIYRGEDAVAWSVHATLEDTARLLWAQPDNWAPRPPRRRAIAGESAKARGLAFLSRRAAADAPSFGRAPAQLALEAYDLLCGMTDALAGDAAADGAPLHRRLADTWGLSAARADILRRTLALTADHELNPSTFAARVAASTGAPLAAAALAGCAALVGPLHGEAAARAIVFLDAALRDGPAATVRAVLARGERLPAIGHPLYPQGDPRAAALLAALKPRPAIASAIAAAEDALGLSANIDMALAAVTLEYRLPRDAPFVLFAAGRMVGWLAHAMEQQAVGRPIRPRAAYVGP
ncbi:MAG: citrate synthase [Alphaproteobacteria bacterium]|nr:citrate synthase [Alphaproteobacteria bacterium]